MGKRILIISYYFAPQNAIGAVRPTKLAKYLTRMGHEVTVLCGPGMNDRRDPTLERDLGELADVRVIHEWNPLRTYKARKATRTAPVSHPDLSAGWLTQLIFICGGVRTEASAGVPSVR